ncbi:hypothetical protein KCU77_g5530, partial [Aureobasidium melanogenum]
MSTPESTILGLRTQILENCRYMHPGHTIVVILTTRKREGRQNHMHRFEAIIAEDRNMGNCQGIKPCASKQKLLISNSSMASLLALAIKILGSSLQSPQTISLETTTHVDLRAQILENWRYLHPTATDDAIIVLTLKGRLWGH